MCPDCSDPIILPAPLMLKSFDAMFNPAPNLSIFEIILSFLIASLLKLCIFYHAKSIN